MSQPLVSIRSRPLSLTIELLLMLAWREIVIKYKQSVMGFLWAILMPCLIVLSGLIVRVAMARLSGHPLASEVIASLVVKALPWAFVVSAIRFSTNSFLANVNLVTRSNCPRIVFPFASVLSALVDFGIASVPAVLALVVLGVPAGLQMLWAVPLLLLLVVFVGSLGLLLATANLFYRDVRYIVEVFLTFGIFFTPVFFEPAMLGEWAWLVMLNPVSPILEGLNASIARAAPPDLGWVAYSLAWTIVIGITATWVYRRTEPIFADRI